MKTRDNFCPSCRTNLDAAACITHKDHIPSPGDFTICLYCGVILRFGARLVLEIPKEVPADVQAQRERLKRTLQSFIR